MDQDGPDSRLVIVTDVYGATGSVRVALLSQEVEMGDDVDFVVPKVVSGLSFDLVCLPDVSGPAWMVQLGPVLASLGEKDLQELRDTPAGLPLRDQLDARWRWKERQHDALLDLTGECRRQVLDGDPDTVIDPAAMTVDTAGPDGFARMARITAELVDQGKACLPVEAVQELLAVEPSTGSPLWEPLRLLSGVLPRSPLALMSRRVLDAASPIDLPCRRQVHGDRLPRSLHAFMLSQSDMHRASRVVTVAGLWVRSDMDDPRLAPGCRAVAPGVFEMTVDGTRRQLVVLTVDEEEDVCV
jgi:hypothetical protein